MGLGVCFTTQTLSFCFWIQTYGDLAPTPKTAPEVKPGSAGIFLGPSGQQWGCRRRHQLQTSVLKENFYNCIFVVPMQSLSRNINDTVSSSDLCHMVFDCLNQKAVPSCISTAISLLDYNDSWFSRMRRSRLCPKPMIWFVCLFQKHPKDRYFAQCIFQLLANISSHARELIISLPSFHFG